MCNNDLLYLSIYFEEQGADVRLGLILQWIWNKYNAKVRTGVCRFRMEFSGEILRTLTKIQIT